MDYIQNVVDYPMPIRWTLRGWEGKDFYYACTTALFHGSREEDCKTPTFKREEISEDALEYMHHFAKVFCLGYQAGCRLRRPE